MAENRRQGRGIPPEAAQAKVQKVAHESFGGDRPVPGLFRFEAHLFGPFMLSCDGVPVAARAWRRNSARMVLKWFLLHPSQTFSVDHLCRLFWPGGDRSSSVNSLHVSVHHLRTQLNPDRQSRAQKEGLFSDRSGYRFEPDNDWWCDVYDVAALTSAAERAETQRHALEATRCYMQLIRYYQQGFLPEDVYEGLFADFTYRYEMAHASCLARVMELGLASGSHSSVLECVALALELDPYDETAIRAGVEVHLRSGSRTAAIGELDRFGRFLAAELGVSLSPELTLLRRTIVEQR